MQKAIYRQLKLTEQGRIHDHISRERWAGALMEVRSLFGLNSETGYGRTDRRTDKASYRVACSRLKMRLGSFERAFFADVKTYIIIQN